MEGFTPLAGLAGGALIGLAVAILWIGLGRVAGISGIFSNAIMFHVGATARWLFIAGLVIGAWLFIQVSGITFPVRDSLSLPYLAIAGLLVGLGTRLGGGCTSGHGVCGLARFSIRSVVATGVFMFVAGITVFVTRHILGLPT